MSATQEHSGEAATQTAIANAERAAGRFGLTGVTIAVDPLAGAQDLTISALCLLREGLSVIEAMADFVPRLPETHFAAVYLLRQADIVLEKALDMQAER